MLETGETCRLKGDKKTEYVVVEVHFEDDGETLKGYHLMSYEARNHWIRAERIAPPKKTKKRKRATKGDPSS